MVAGLLASCCSPTSIRPPEVQSRDTSAGFQAAAEIPNKRLEPKEKWYAKLLLSQDDNVDLVEAATILANDRLGTSHPYRTIPSVLAASIVRAKGKLSHDSSPEEKISLLNIEVLPTIHEALKKELHWLHDAFGAESGDCFPSTLLYLIAADALSLRMQAVDAPKHMFACYESGTFRRNVETTDKGQHLSFEQYRIACSKDEKDTETLPADESSLRKYLVPLTRRRLVSSLLCQSGPRSSLRVKDCELAIQLTPDFYYPLKKLSAHFGMLADWPKAEELADKAIRHADYVPVLYVLRCISRIGLKKIEDAVRDADAALRLSPAHGLYHLWRCVALYLNTDYSDALDAGTRAVQAAPSLVDGWKWRGGCFEMLKRYKEAAADFTRAIELDPKSPDLRRKRAKMWAMLGDEAAWQADLDKARELESRP